MTVEYLQFHAAERPGGLAFADDTRAVSFAAMLGDFGKVTAALRMIGLAPGQSVAIGHDDFYTHWLLLLALEHLGIATASFQRNEGPAAQALLGAVDVVLAQPDYPQGGWRTLNIDADWLAPIQAWPDHDPGPAAIWRPNQVHRIVRTSSTTGTQKRLNQSYGMWRARLAQMVWFFRDIPAGAALLLTLPISVALAQRYAAMALASGLGFVAANRAGIGAVPDLIRRHRVGALFLLPIQLKQLLDVLPEDWEKPADLEISTAGAPLPPALRAAALDRLARRIANLYGTNETGMISASRSGGDADDLIIPGTQVQIVDEQGREVPDGQPGQLCVRGSGVFAGYADDPSLSRRVLRDGWFFSGDIGIRRGRRLRLVGRDGEQANGRAAP